MLRKHQRFFNTIQVFLDTLSLVLAYTVSVLLRFNQTEISRFGTKYLLSSIWMVPILLVAYYFMNVYSPMRSRPFRKEALLIVRAHFVGFVIINSLLFFNKHLEFSREVSLLFAILGVFFIFIERYLIRRILQYLRRTGHNQKFILIIGAGPIGLEFCSSVLSHKDYGYNIVGFLDDSEKMNSEFIMNKPVLGGCEDLSYVLEHNHIDEVVVALPFTVYDKFVSIIDICEDIGIRVRVIPDYNKLFHGTPVIEQFDGIPLLNIRRLPLDDPFNKYLKRLFDIIVSTIAIIITGPIMLFIAIGIKLTSPGPVFFKQERVGFNNNCFNMLKFRSMRVDDNTTASTTWTTANDPRKTKFGTFLRKTSLDELPQFFNVLFGTMSVIGPRPERPYFVQQFRKEIPKYMVKHQVKPGITGWAQVNGWRGDTSIAKRIECDIYYIENWDILLDIKIMFMTIFKGLVNKNAY